MLFLSAAVWKPCQKGFKSPLSITPSSYISRDGFIKAQSWWCWNNDKREGDAAERGFQTFKRPASQHSGWSQLCRRRTFGRLLKVESDLATVDYSQYYYMRQENGEAYSIFVPNLTRSPANCKYSLWWYRLLNLYSHVRQCAAAA